MTLFHCILSSSIQIYSASFSQNPNTTVPKTNLLFRVFCLQRTNLLLSYCYYTFFFAFWLLFGLITQTVFNRFQWNFQRLCDFIMPQSSCSFRDNITSVLSILKFLKSHFVRGVSHKCLKIETWHFLWIYICHFTCVIRLKIKVSHLRFFT